MVTAGSFRAGGLFIFVKEMINIAIKLATSITCTADGSQTNFSIPFDYLRPSFVHVSVNDAEVSEGFTISNRMVMFDSAPAKDAVVHIYRNTPTTRLVSWADASILKAIDMTIAEVQQLHILEEANDWSKTHSIVFDEESGVWQGRNYRVSNVSDPTEAQDVVTKNYLENTEDSFVQRMNAIKTQTEQFANTAGNSKDSAYKSAQSASVSAASAAESAKLAEGYKNIAETAKSDASLYAANAKTSADNAGASKEAAQSAATTASNFASDARNSANEAQTYRNNAKTYMDNAKNYSENVNVFVPSVSTEGVLSWTNKAGLTNPKSVNIKGAKGDKGDTGAQGIQGVKGDKGDTGAQGLQGVKGDKGDKGDTGAQGIQGVKGDTGATGAPGAAATIRIGNVYTGAPGTNASVSNSGTSTNAVLNFTIPRGNPGADGGVTVDAELSNTSTNPIQNKAVKTAIDTVTASIPTKVSDLENDAGYLTQHQSLDDYAKKNTANTWSAQQSFKQVLLGAERYLSPVVSGSSNTPQMPVMHYIVTGAFTLSLLKIVASLEVRNSTVFTAYIESSADYPLSITDAGTLKYIGYASDIAITSAGLLLNILMMRDTNDNVTSIVQASKLS